MPLNDFYMKFFFTGGLEYRHNNFFLVKVPFVMCPNEVLAGMLEVGSPDFVTRLYSSVRDSVNRHLIEQFGTDFGYHGEKMVSFVQSYFTASGWGLIQNIDLDMGAKHAIVTLTNNPFAERLRGKVAMPADHILRGILAGLYSYAFQEKVDCVEIHCAALGEDNCEFIIKRQNEFDFSDKRVQQQIMPEI